MVVSLKDVAREAGVSVCTVSRVINNTYRHKVSDATRKRVYDAMKKLNYEPNLNARGLVKKRTHLIGLLVSRLVVSFVSEIVQGIQDEADKHNYSILFYSTYNDVVKEKACFEALRRKRVDGIIYMPGAADFCTSEDGKRYLQSIISQGTKIVQMCSNYPQFDTPYVIVDNEAGGYTATMYLVSLGHTRLPIFTRVAPGMVRKDLLVISWPLRRQGFPSPPNWSDLAAMIGGVVMKRCSSCWPCPTGQRRSLPVMICPPGAPCRQ